VVVGLANHAGPDGTAAFPSLARLVRYTGLAERTVRTCLDRLAAGGIIAPCDPDIVAARIKRADRRPQGWDLIPYGCCGVKLLGQVFQAVGLVLVVCGHAGAARRLVAVRRRGDLG
jgi:hypothetical protein